MKPLAISHPFRIMPRNHALRLISSVKLTAPSGESECVATALWDTGAAHSAIARSVADNIGLKPIDSVTLSTFTGSSILASGMVSVHICLDGYVLETMMAVMDDAAMSDHKVTLGLDFISMGDFAISHDKDGYPVFAFQYPPLLNLDFPALAGQSGLDIAAKEFDK